MWAWGLSLLFIFSLANADDVSQCGFVDESQSIALGAIDDQGKSNICYAYVASYLVGHELNKKINPFDIAIRYELAKSPEQSERSAFDVFVDGVGYADVAANKIKDQGFLVNCEAAQKFSQNMSVKAGDYLAGLQNQCERVSFNKEVVRHETEDFGNDKLFQELTDQINNHKLVGVFAHRSFFIGKPSDSKFSHVITLVGRRWNDQSQRCEYVFRNTRGVTADKEPILNDKDYFLQYKNGYVITNAKYLIDKMEGIYFVD